jgi:hypothetical protein
LDIYNEQLYSGSTAFPGPYEVPDVATTHSRL